MNIFNENIIVKDNNLNTYALNLLNTYYEVSANKEATVIELQKYANTLRNQLVAVEGKYIVTAPMVTKDEQVIWYYIINNKEEKFVGVNTASGSRKGRLLLTDEVTDEALWSFASTGKPGVYKLYNAGQQGFVYKDGNYLKTPAPAAEDYIPVAVAYDAENGGLLFSAADKLVYANGSNVQLSATKSYWRVQIALIENNKEVADIITTIETVIPEATEGGAIYDLNGRRVVNPTRGIFIQGGKKVLVK